MTEVIVVVGAVGIIFTSAVVVVSTVNVKALLLPKRGDSVCIYIYALQTKNTKESDPHSYAAPKAVEKKAQQKILRFQISGIN